MWNFGWITPLSKVTCLIYLYLCSLFWHCLLCTLCHLQIVGIWLSVRSSPNDWCKWWRTVGLSNSRFSGSRIKIFLNVQLSYLGSILICKSRLPSLKNLLFFNISGNVHGNVSNVISRPMSLKSMLERKQNAWKQFLNACLFSMQRCYFINERELGSSSPYNSVLWAHEIYI